MSRRGWWAGGTLVGLLIVAFWSSTLINGVPMRQANPTEQQQTIDAILQERFQQTALAQQQLGATQTIDAAFNQALTGTTGFNATINASFAQAASATAGVPLTQNAATVAVTTTALAATRGAPLTQYAANAAATTTALAATLTTNCQLRVDVGTDTGNSLRLREQPNNNATIVLLIPNNALVTKVAKSKEVSAGGYTWVNIQYSDPNGVISTGWAVKDPIKNQIALHAEGC